MASGQSRTGPVMGFQKLGTFSIMPCYSMPFKGKSIGTSWRDVLDALDPLVF